MRTIRAYLTLIYSKFHANQLYILNRGSLLRAEDGGGDNTKTGDSNYVRNLTCSHIYLYLTFLKYTYTHTCIKNRNIKLGFLIHRLGSGINTRVSCC